MQAIPGRIDSIKAYKAQGGKVAGVLPIHYPRELLRAFNFLPVEIWGPPGVDPSYGSAHLQPYVCSIVRNALSFLNSGGLDIVDLFIVPHACDSLQGLGSILLDFVRPRQPVIPLYLPRGNRASDLAFLAQELKSLYEKLAALTGSRPSEEKLRACLQREVEADKLIAQLREKKPALGLPDRQFYRLLRAREYLPAEEFTRLAAATLKGAQAPQEDDRVPVILSGILPEPYELFDIINRNRGVVAADDLACCGRRVYPPGNHEDVFYRIAQRILAATPDAMLGRPIAQRVAHITNLAQAVSARGVIFYIVKFCEPELFDLPLLSTSLEKHGLRTLVVDMELNQGLSQHVVTRLEAFLETLQ